MSAPAAVGVDDNLSSRETGVSLRPTNNEQSGRLDLDALELNVLRIYINRRLLHDILSGRQGIWPE